MEKPSGYTALLDSSVLFPVFISNLLLFLAERQLFKAKWTAKIHKEWIDSRMERYPDGSRAALESKRDVMDQQFEEALVTDYEELIDKIALPDANDQHVLAAARTCKADVIVTDNPKDFPSETLAPLGLFAQPADDFIADQVGVSAESEKMVAIAIVRHKKSLTTSRLNWKQYLAQLGQRLPETFKEVNTHRFRSVIAQILASQEWHYE